MILPHTCIARSDRLIDRMLASGRERKAAVEAVSEAAARLRSLGSA